MATAVESPLITGYLYKRRGGFGSLMPNAWQHRLFMISRDGVLSYFDNESSGGAADITDSKPRGCIDLKAIPYELEKTAGGDGTPTNFAFNLCPLGHEKWKLCADTREQRDQWCGLLEKFIGEKVHHDQATTSSGAAIHYHSDDDEGTPVTQQKTMKSIFGGGRASTPTPQQQQAASSNNNAMKSSPSVAAVAVSPTSSSQPSSPPTSSPPSKPSQQATKGTAKRGLKVAKSTSIISADTLEMVTAVLIINICIYMSRRSIPLVSYLYMALANFVLVRTLNLRSQRLQNSQAALANAEANAERKAVGVSTKKGGPGATSTTTSQSQSEGASTQQTGSEALASSVVIGSSGKPIAGSTMTQVTTAPRQSPDHTWCKAEYQSFKVRVGPDYKRNQRKAPTGPPLFEPVAVDIFCTKQRLDHASQRFQLPDTSHINTHHPHVPPIFVVQIQIPSEPPPSVFSSVEDGPGWAILIYFMITEDTCKQLANFQTASPAVKLFATYCEKAVSEGNKEWGGRFKVINSCTNLDEMGMPSVIVQYNAKPVLIRRTGSLFRGPNYVEKDIHVHKFANMAKQPIHLISSRCGKMYMSIGFVIEGREDSELPEVLFGCVAVNKPQEDQAEFLFDDPDA